MPNAEVADAKSKLLFSHIDIHYKYCSNRGVYINILFNDHCTAIHQCRTMEKTRAKKMNWQFYCRRMDVYDTNIQEKVDLFQHNTNESKAEIVFFPHIIYDKVVLFDCEMWWQIGNIIWAFKGLLIGYKFGIDDRNYVRQNCGFLRVFSEFSFGYNGPLFR